MIIVGMFFIFCVCLFKENNTINYSFKEHCTYQLVDNNNIGVDLVSGSQPSDNIYISFLYENTNNNKVSQKFLKIENNTEIEYVESDANSIEYDLYCKDGGDNSNVIAKNIKILYTSLN